MPTTADPRPRRAVAVLVVVAVLLTVVPLSAACYLARRLTSGVGRIDGVFAGLPAADRPARPARGAPGAGAIDVLVLGSDPGLGTLTLLHVDGRRRVAAAVSLPPGARVTVPGRGAVPLGRAAADGGPGLAVAAVERLTGLRVDHVAVLDWAGIGELVDHLGGIDVDVTAPVPDPDGGPAWPVGTARLDASEALRYARADTAGGDLDRARRQQGLLQAILQASLQQEMRKDPLLLWRFLDALARHVSLDAGWSAPQLARLALSMRGFHSVDLHFVPAPVLPTAASGTSGEVLLDPVAGALLWRDLRTDAIDGWSVERWARAATGAYGTPQIR